jgi:Flp pilus assembly protein TadG
MLYAEGVERGLMCHSPRTHIRLFCVRLVTKWKEELGAELVEAALVLPILLMLLLGIVSFGRAYNVYQTITRAAREGAKQAVLTPCAVSIYCAGATNYTANDIWTNFVYPALQSDNLNTTKVTGTSLTYVQLDPTGTPPHVCGLQLRYNYPYTFSLPFTSLNLSTITLRTTVRARLENQPATCPVGTNY